jgi:hypothetical protein
MRPIAALKMRAGKTVQLINKQITVSTISVNAAGTLSLTNAGVASGNGTFAFSYSWLLSGAASSYEIMATLQGSTTLSSTGDTRGAWLALSTSRSWSYTKSGVGEDTASLLIQIRPTGGSPIASCTVNFDCTVN